MAEEKKASDNALGLGANFTANKAERSTELAGRALSLEVGARQIDIDFTDAFHLRWRAAADQPWADEAYEAQKIEEGLFLISFQHGADAMQSTAVIADLTSGEVVHIHNTVGTRVGDEPAVAQSVTLGRVKGAAVSEPRIGLTSDLFGRRAMWVYSEDDVYEHIYLNADWYVWHCLKGEEYPHADIDPCKMFKLRDNIYLLTFSEVVMTMAAGMVLDFGRLQSYCAALGRDPETDALTHFGFGAHGKILSQTNYPDPLAVKA